MTSPTAVIIPTLNEEDNIGAALAAIRGGSAQPEDLIVVDGGSTDRTVAIAERYGARVVFNSKVHAAAARNLGIAQTQAELLVFTDADCIPHPDWLGRIAHRFNEDADLAGIGGRMVPHQAINEIEAFSARVFIDEVMCFSLETQTHTHWGLANGLITANCAYRRAALLACGGFRDVFANYGEDLDLMWRMLDRFKLVYDPDLVVSHQFPSTLKGLSRKYIQYGIASSLLTRYFLKPPRIDWAIYRKLCRNLGKALSIDPRTRRFARMYVVQLSSHLLGKYIGSLRFGTVNL